MREILCIAIGLFAGISGGIFGIGGGIVMIPAMIYLLGFDQKTAQGTSIATLLMPIGIFGVMNYWRGGKVDLPVAGLIAAGFLGGAYAGSKLALDLPEVLLRRLFAGFLIVVAIQLILKK